MKKYFVKIEGINCNHCIATITKKLLTNSNIKNVTINKDIATISYIGTLKKDTIIDLITSIDYFTKEDYISDNIENIKVSNHKKTFLMIIVVILIIILINLLGYDLIPTIDKDITYPILFLTGLLTSIHCLSMCGSINLIAITGECKILKKSIHYNLGRLISYTLLGGIVGLIGKSLSINDEIKGSIIIIASILMLIISLKMLGIIKIKPHQKIPKVRSRNPFLIGVLNGFMPCGPLQAMQVYALSTGSPLKGATSMFIFCLGTIPLMLLVGFFLGSIKGKKKILLNNLTSILIFVLSILMLGRGLLYFNINLTNKINNSSYISSIIKDNYQEVTINIDYSNYQDIIVKKDIPVKMIIHIDKNKLTGCNNKIIIRKYNIEKELKEGDNLIEFTPTKEETINYTCWMNMISNKIKVIS